METIEVRTASQALPWFSSKTSGGRVLTTSFSVTLRRACCWGERGRVEGVGVVPPVRELLAYFPIPELLGQGGPSLV